MRKIALFIITTISALTAFAQEQEYLDGMKPVPTMNVEPLQMPDSLRLPTLDWQGRMPVMNSWHYPYIGGGLGWNLHEGLNVNLGLSAFTSFGKNHFSGTAERIAAMYAKAINKKISFAVGGYFTNLNSGIGNFRQGGITAVLNYRFNEKWEAFVYGQKSIVTNASGMRYNPYYLHAPYDLAHLFGDRIGAGVRYNITPSMWVELQVEVSKANNDLHQNIVNRSFMPGQNTLP